MENKELKQQMRNLIKYWKTLNDAPVTTTQAPPPAATLQKQNSVQSNDSLPTQTTQSTAVSEPKKPEPAAPSNQNADGSFYTTPVDYCGDQNRDKARDLIAKALRSKFPEPMHSSCNRRAVQLEKGLDELYGNNLKKYKLQLMSKISNLKDDKNPSLRESLINGTITGAELAAMTPADMASDELKAKNEKMKAENLLEHQVAVQQGTETDMFQCGKCKQKKCTYNQLQTRSSDEPMTTFVFCMNCGNRWKFC